MLLKKSRKNQNYIYRNSKKESLTGWMFILPSLAGVSIFYLIPFADVVRRSVTEGMGVRFVGLRNYITVLENEAFLLASANTIKFMLLCIPLLLIFSLLFGVIIKSLNGKAGIYKTAFLVPLAVPVASIVLMWRFLFHENGFFSMLAVSILGNPIDFMNTDLAVYVLIISYLWKNTGYDMILWIAGLSGIPSSLYEAASVDGAGRFKQFFYITLPNLRGMLFIIFILSVINSFKVFREAYLIGGNYPHTSMYMLQHLFNNWFVALDIEKLCAGAVIISIATSALIIFFRNSIQGGK
ncbi:sugar ABC transporter permease [Sedimentibacter hydroxybenzoicus DSM 7310]|uniref:Sugar ABC transporter permease n=1 Tax=Sedimentibacter hydroxybenzoicus DSM 7310 TaxID=1123245 RepID=A0A974BJE8_SEDHY|nr:sugar ABC transporter permease [Sedimentibacter hydroxybenzoicus]NYB73745.1 sugar ABC transporter permease [Sedimentibacter hydroxybenzoicus DSM 7310]